jgi:hypothetical protein
MEKIQKCELAHALKSKRLVDLSAKLATDELTDEVADALGKITDEISETERNLADSIFDFFVAGLVAGGCDIENAKRIASWIEPSRLSEIKSSCLIGCGVLDFSKANSQARRS